MPQIFAISGFHNSGKTKVGENVVKYLIERGYKVAVVKSTKEEGFLTDKENSDTYRYRQAGAQAVSLLQKDAFTLYYSKDLFNNKNVVELFEKIFYEFDVILLEGFKNLKGVTKIWVKREEDNLEIIKKKYPGIELFVFPEDIEQCLAFIESKLIKKDIDRSVCVNFKKICSKHFTQVILKNFIFLFINGYKEVLKKLHKLKELNIYNFPR
ncbi:MAG: molybdopterin-guanine dinucleotide biosynthesis protein B [Caldimicrobium sp.]